jgi:hypothetical protein
MTQRRSTAGGCWHGVRAGSGTGPSVTAYGAEGALAAARQARAYMRSSHPIAPW